MVNCATEEAQSCSHARQCQGKEEEEAAESHYPFYPKDAVR